MEPELFFLDAAVRHLRQLEHRVPTFGVERGQATTPEDFEARTVILHSVLQGFVRGLLNRLHTFQAAVAQQIFNSFMDERISLAKAVEECGRRCASSGHMPTAFEWLETARQLLTAWKLQHVDRLPR